MKNFDYIEYVINDVVSEKTELQLIELLINDPELREQYHHYIQVAEDIERQENIIRSVTKGLTGYTFKIKDAASLPGWSGDQSDSSGIEKSSRIIRTVIEELRPPKPGEKNGWLLAAAVFTKGSLIMIFFLPFCKVVLLFCDLLEVWF